MSTQHASVSSHVCSPVVRDLKLDNRTNGLWLGRLIASDYTAREALYETCSQGLRTFGSARKISADIMASHPETPKHPNLTVCGKKLNNY